LNEPSRFSIQVQLQVHFHWLSFPCLSQPLALSEP
jgi:hypothetical protein